MQLARLLSPAMAHLPPYIFCSQIGVIPARYASTRFPGKPLVKILGKPMIQVIPLVCMPNDPHGARLLGQTRHNRFGSMSIVPGIISDRLHGPLACIHARKSKERIHKPWNPLPLRLPVSLASARGDPPEFERALGQAALATNSVAHPGLLLQRTWEQAMNAKTLTHVGESLPA